MDAKELKKIIQLCKSQGVLKLEMGEIKLELSREALTKTKPVIDSKQKSEDVVGYTEEEILNWSSTAPGLDQ